MKTVSLFTPISYLRQTSYTEKTLSTLSHYFYLGGNHATVIESNNVSLKNEKISWYIIALKVASYVLLFPLTLTLLVINVALRSEHNFIVINTSTHPTNPSKIEIKKPIKIKETIITTTLNKSKTEFFGSFNVKISNQNSFIVSSKEDMNLKVEEIAHLVSDKHIKLRIDLSPIYELEKTQARQFIEKLNTVSDVIPTEWEDMFYILPKKIEETQQDGLIIRKYQNEVIEKVQPSIKSKEEGKQIDWEGQRIYRDGTIETGIFKDFCLFEGSRVEKEKTTYLLPTPLVIPKNPDFGDLNPEHIQLKQTLILTLTEILKTENHIHEKSLQEILSGPIDCSEFITSLFNTNSIFLLESYPLQILLMMIKEKGIHVNLHQKNPSTGETLLDSLWDEQITQKLIDLDPTLIQRTEGKEIAFVNSLLSENREKAAVILKAMESQNIPLLPRELLFKKIAFAEAKVTLEELKDLSIEDQKIAYLLANIYFQRDILQAMTELGFKRNEELIMREGPSILGCNMTLLEMHEQLKKFLKDLRSEQLLLTQTEFNQLSSENYVEKSRDISRILGRNYIEKKARQLGLKHIKVPRKMIVVDDNDPNIELYIKPNLNIQSTQRNITIYAEKIQECKREITDEEVLELFKLFEATNFCDIHWGNVLIAKDGVYIIDTEFDNFDSSPHYDKIKKFSLTLPDTQRELINDLIIKNKPDQKNQEEINQKITFRLASENAAINKSGRSHCSCLTFPFNELLS